MANRCCTIRKFLDENSARGCKFRFRCIYSQNLFWNNIWEEVNQSRMLLLVIHWHKHISTLLITHLWHNNHGLDFRSGQLPIGHHNLRVSTHVIWYYCYGCKADMNRLGPPIRNHWWIARCLTVTKIAIGRLLAVQPYTLGLEDMQVFLMDWIMLMSHQYDNRAKSEKTKSDQCNNAMSRDLP